MMDIFQGIVKDRINVGLLLLRVFSGYLILVNHGYGKITAGPSRWEKLGGAMERLGIDFFPTSGDLWPHSQSRSVVCFWCLVFSPFLLHFYYRSPCLWQRVAMLLMVRTRRKLLSLVQCSLRS